MRPTELTELLSVAIPERLAILIQGAPGVGKSDIVAKACAQAGTDLIISHPVVSDPTDAKGLPWVGSDKKSATFLPFGEMKRALDAKVPTVWFLDDLGQASPAVQASFMQLLLARRVNGHVLPDCVTFLAATNRRTDRAGVAGLLEPVKSRFVSIVELEAHAGDWCEWALAANLPTEVLSFIRFRPDLLHDFKPTADLANSPSPRTWAHVAKLVQLGLPSGVLLEAVKGAVGEGAGTEFFAFYSMFRSLPNLDAIILNPDGASIPTEPSVLYATATGLASKASDVTFASLGRFMERLVDAQQGEFAVMMLRDCSRRWPDCVHHPMWVKLTTGKLGKLYTGK